MPPFTGPFLAVQLPMWIDIALWVPSTFGLLWFLNHGFLPWLLELIRNLERSEQKTLETIIERLGLLREKIQAGIPPEAQDWEALAALPKPWGPLSFRLLEHLREQGAAVVPALSRLELSARQEKRARSDAQVQTAQARSQIVLGLALVPIAATILALVLPSVQESWELWLGATTVAIALNGLGLKSVLDQIEQAVRGGLPQIKRGWPSQARCAGEAVLAYLRGGCPPDQAWMLAMDSLHHIDESHATVWGRSLWIEAELVRKGGSAESFFQSWGAGLRRILHVALMEGYSSSERLEAALTSFSDEWNHRVLDQVSRSATKALRPLFLSLFPSLIGLVCLAVFLELTHG